MTKRIAVSFDDVPHDPGAFLTPDQRTDLLIGNLARAGIEQAAFFVVVGDLDQPRGVGGAQRIAAYTEAGHVLGSHGYAHPALSDTPVADYLADLDRAARWFVDRPGARPWFRFPFLDEGDAEPAKRAAVRDALRVRGLRNGYVTVLTLDWLLDSLAAPGRDLREFYVRTLVAQAEFYEALAVAALHRSPAHVILLHENDLNALFIADLADALRAGGWEIVSTDEAYQDPIASMEPVEWNGSGRVAGLALDRGHRIDCDLLDQTAVRAAIGRE